MTIKESIKAIEKSWIQPGGFLFELNEGRYEFADGEAFIAKLHKIKSPRGATISRRLVNVLWQIPFYLNDRRADVLENGGDIVAFDQFQLMVNVIVEDLLGGPTRDNDKAPAASTDCLEEKRKRSNSPREM